MDPLSGSPEPEGPAPSATTGLAPSAITGPAPDGSVTADRRPGHLDLVAGALLVVACALHVVAMFPAYFVTPGLPHQSLASQPDQAALYGVMAAAWLVPLAVALVGPHRTPAAAGLAAGLAATELGFRLADVGDVWRYGASTAGSGLWLMVAAWAVGAAAAVVAVLAVRGRLGRSGEASPEAEPPHERTAWIMLTVVLGAVVAGTFLPAWDHVSAVSSVSGRSLSRNLGNGFAGPWQQVTGTVLAAAALLLVPVVTSFWRRRGVAAGATAGSLLVLMAQFVAALVQVDQPVSPTQLGISPTQASQLGLHLSLQLTGWFTVDVLAAYALLGAVLIRANLHHHHHVQAVAPA